MGDLVVIATLLGALSAGVVSPGPSFLLVAQTAMAGSRRSGVLAALGMGVAAALLAAVALVGLHAALSGSATFVMLLQLLGGLYLLYLASRIWRSAASAPDLEAPEPRTGTTGAKAFGLALATMLSNPKAAVQYGVIFAALLPGTLSLPFSATVVALVFLLEAGWYVVVALVLSSRAPRAAYLARKSAIDRTAAVVMALLGVRLVVAAARAI